MLYGTSFTDDYFIVMDEAPIKGSPVPKYDLMFGDPDEATGTLQASASTIQALVFKVPDGCPVYRVYLRRTDGKEGKKLLPRKEKPVRV